MADQLKFFVVLMAHGEQEKKPLPPQRHVSVVHDEQMSSVCKVLAFYRKYKIEFQISAMVFCFIGGKVKPHPLFSGVLISL